MTTRNLKQKYKTKKPLKVPCECGHKSAGIPEEMMDERKIHRGAKIEFEHTCNKEVAERIAADHIAEFPVGYYEELDKMEAKLKKINKRKKPKVAIPPLKKKNCKVRRK
jgi:hypothetical protein